jgi:hypothetical protein
MLFDRSIDLRMLASNRVIRDALMLQDDPPRCCVIGDVVATESKIAASLMRGR